MERIIKQEPIKLKEVKTKRKKDANRNYIKQLSLLSMSTN